MRRFSFAATALLLPVLGLFLASSGCNKGDKKTSTPVADGDKTTPEPAKAEALAAKLGGTIKGKITFEGDRPEIGPLPVSADHKDRDKCLMGKDYEKQEQKWIIAADGGVANVLVALKPPTGKYFAFDKEMKFKELVELDQPHCAFIPHVVSLFPQGKDKDGKTVKTKQIFRIKNGAKFPHNSKFEGTRTNKAKFDQVIPPGEHFDPTPFLPEDNPLTIRCSFHSFMAAEVWVFDHPFHAVTDLEGNYTIENVPVDVEVTIYAWHEAKGRFVDQPITVKTGAPTEFAPKVKK